MNFDSDREGYSQSGEDGVIEYCLDKIGETDKWCVEFGAWDGIYLSNSRGLITNKGFSGVLIEGAAEKYNELSDNYKANDDVFTINKFVGFEGPDLLDNILEETPIPLDFDLLSIDIDGNDYHIWEALSKYTPKLVVIEFNHTIPTEISYVQEADPGVSCGCSLMALVELGKAKGYELVSVLGCNAFFVRAKYFELFQIVDNSPFVLRDSTEHVTYMFSSYDGQIILQGSQRLPWHSINFSAGSMQPLPKMLREFPPDYNNAQRILWYGYLFMQQFLESPITALKKAFRKITEFRKIIA